MPQIVKPYQYTNGQLIDANQLDANLDTLYTAINGNLDGSNLKTGLNVDINGVIDVKSPAYNASGSELATTGSITSGSFILTLTAALNFVNGQGISIAGAGVSGATLVTSIANGAGTTQLTLNTAASTTATSVTVSHNDDVAINAALATVSSVYGGTVFFPPGTYLISSQLTITINKTKIAGIGTIKAAAEANFQNMIYGTGLSEIEISGIVVDVNQANRVSSLTTRSNGIYLDSVTDSIVKHVLVKNAIGYTSITGFGIAVAGTSVRSKVSNSIVENCGISGKASDGIFVSGTQCTINTCLALSCNDTAFVVESSQQSGINDCVARSCGVGGAVTNASSVSANDNYINGLNIYDWDSSVTGGIQIGALSTGDLLNTLLTNINTERVAGSGPAIAFRQTSTGLVNGATLSDFRINGAGSQGILVKGTSITIEDGNIKATTGTPIQIQSGSSDITIQGNKIKTGAGTSFCIYSDSTSDVYILYNRIDANSVASYGVYFANTASRCKANFNDIKNANTARVGSDAGTTPDVVAALLTGNGFEFDKTADTNLYRAGSTTLKTDQLFIAGKGFQPPTLTDAAAGNNVIYYSSTASKLVYKDSGGTVNNLY